MKIGNPVAHTRLTQLRALADDVAAGRVPPTSVQSAVLVISAATDTWAATTATHSPSPDAPARQVQELFRHAADAADWLEVAALVEGRHPAIAQLLRVYGAGRVSAAEEHWRTTFGS